MLDIRDHGGIFGGVNTNKYKRWASGQFTYNGSKITISGLTFRPKIVLFVHGDYTEVLINPSDYPAGHTYQDFTHFGVYGTTTHTLITRTSLNSVIKNDGFDVTLGGGTAGSTVYWYAFE